MSKRALVLLAACGGTPAAPSPAPTPAPPPAPALQPKPGLDLTGPIPLPDRRGPAHHTPLPMLDLASDRAVVHVSVPIPPAGGTVGFTFGDERTGWVARLPEGESLPALAYGNGRVYTSGGFNSVTFYALDATTGHIEWASTNLRDGGPTAPIYDDDHVLFNTESCTLFALDAKTGKVLWQNTIGSPTLAQTAAQGGLVYASHPGETGGQLLSAYSVKDGHEVWGNAIDGELLAAPVIAGDFVYASTVGGMTYRFARTSGRLSWSRGLDATTAPWIAGDELYVTRHKGTREQQVVVAAGTGKVLREQQVSNGKYAWDVPEQGTSQEVWQFEGSRPVIDRGVRYVAMGGELVASDAVSGELLWQRRYAGKAEQRSLGSVALAGSAIVVATRDGKLFGLDIDTGYTLWSYSIGHRVRAEPVIAKGWVYATTEDGYVVALDVADATLDGWHMFGGNAQHEGLVTDGAPAKPAVQGRRASR